MLHGWGANIGKLQPLSQKLRVLGWQVYIPKMPGFELPSPQDFWGIIEYTSYILKKSSQVFNGQKFFVFGHSFGGRIAIKMAARYPRQLNGVILCSAGGISRGYKIGRLFFYLLAKIGKTFLIFPPLALFWRKFLYKLAREHDYEKTKGVMREVFKKVVSEDFRSQVSLIKIPTLILWGKQDKVTPVKDAFFIRGVLDNSKLQIFEDQGHRLPYEKPGEVAKEIEKWAKSLN